MEQDKKSRDKPTHLWYLICDKGGKNIHREKIVSSRSVTGKIGQPLVKE